MITKSEFRPENMLPAVFVILSALISCSWANGSPVKLPVRFGSVAEDTPAAMHKRLVPLKRYLARQLGRPVKLVLSPDMKHAINNIVAGNVDIAYLTPVSYIRSRELAGTRLLAKTVTAGKGSFRLVIVVRKDSHINSVKDLVGKTFAFGDRAALLQRAVVTGANIPLETMRYRYLDHFDNIVRAVLNRDYDAGILTGTRALKWKSRGIRILYRSQELPPYNITASRTLDEKTLRKIRKAFLSLDISNPEHRKVIRALSDRYTGFTSTSDREYNIVRTMIRPFRVKR